MRLITFNFQLNIIPADFRQEATLKWQEQVSFLPKKFYVTAAADLTSIDKRCLFYSELFFTHPWLVITSLAAAAAAYPLCRRSNDERASRRDLHEHDLRFCS